MNSEVQAVEEVKPLTDAEKRALMEYAVAAGDAIVAADITVHECRHGVPLCLGPCFFCVNGTFGSGPHGGQAGPLPGGKLYA